MQRQKLLNSLNILESYRTSNPSREQKLNEYRKIISIRAELNLESNTPDPLGFNLLHWAVLSDQIPETISYLIKHDKIDINAGTVRVSDIHLYNVTPLHFAVQTNNAKLAQLLLDRGADKTVKRMDATELPDLLISKGPTWVTPVSESTEEFALRKKCSVFKLFEKSYVAKLLEERKKDKRDYNSKFPSCCASLFYYSNKQERKAATALLKLFDSEDRLDKAEWLGELIQLKSAHPAVEQDKLGEAYHLSLKIRGL